jgi:hypothetical protein
VLLQPRPGIKVRNVDMTISLESLSYFLARPGSGTEAEPETEFPFLDGGSLNGNDSNHHSQA